MKSTQTTALVSLLSIMLLFVIAAVSYDWYFHRCKRKVATRAASKKFHDHESGINNELDLESGIKVELDLESSTGGLRPLHLPTLVRESDFGDYYMT